MSCYELPVASTSNGPHPTSSVTESYNRPRQGTSSTLNGSWEDDSIESGRTRSLSGVTAISSPPTSYFGSPSSIALGKRRQVDVEHISAAGQSFTSPSLGYPSPSTSGSGPRLISEDAPPLGSPVSIDGDGTGPPRSISYPSLHLKNSRHLLMPRLRMETDSPSSTRPPSTLSRASSPVASSMLDLRKLKRPSFVGKLSGSRLFVRSAAPSPENGSEVSLASQSTMSRWYGRGSRSCDSFTKMGRGTEGSRRIKKLLNLSRKSRPTVGETSGGPPASEEMIATRVPPPTIRSHSAPVHVHSVNDEDRPFGVDCFDLHLPREIKLQIFASLIDVCVEEHARNVAGDKWKGDVAKATRWVGREAGVRELVKVSRVSRAWLDLALDGQLWSKVDIPSMGIDVMSTDALLRIARAAGPFIRDLNLGGLVNLRPKALLSITDASMGILPSGVLETSLTSLNITGCTSISTPALSYLLARSPNLIRLTAPSLPSITSSTLQVLSTISRRLEYLDIGRCSLLEAPSILQLAKSSKICESLRVLRVSKLKAMQDQVLIGMGKSFPNLELLDIRYCPALTDGGLSNFVEALIERDPEDDRIVRPSRLTHLALSGCSGLTDASLAKLAGAVPLLDTLEMAFIGRDLRDEGLMKLLETTPRIRRLDLELAVNLTDRLISVFTSPSSPVGQELEHLILSYVSSITEGSLHQLIRNCPNLKILEVDNTQIADDLVRDFVKTVRKRAILNAEISAVDCRSLTRTAATDLAGQVRPRKGFRGWSGRLQDYHDPTHRTTSKEINEIDENRVVFRSYFALLRLDEADHWRNRRRSSEDDVRMEEQTGNAWARWRTLPWRSANAIEAANERSDRNGSCVIS